MSATKHKAPTSVTLAPLAEASGFDRFVQKYWLFGVIAAVAITAAAVLSQQAKQKTVKARDDSWDKLASRTTPDPLTRVPSAPPEVLTGLASELKGSDAAPWVRWIEANTQVSKHDYAAANAALATLRQEYPQHALNSDKWDFGDGEPPSTASEHLSSVIQKQIVWEVAHGGLFANPPPPADAPRVKLVTDRGDIVVTLYSDLAPEHAASFVKLATEGYYNGTKFHRIQPGKWIDGGDPTSKEGDAASWGKGGTDKVLPKEAATLYHFAGVLTAAAGAKATESLGSLFSITCDVNHAWDGTRVVFGVVTEGLDVVRQISGGELAANSQDVPAQPATLKSIEKL